MSKTLTNEKIAIINDLVYAKVTKRSLQKKLDKRVEGNVKFFENLEKENNKIIKNINFEKLRNEYKFNSTEIGKCSISCYDWVFIF
jgi:hypothetical protein